MSRGKAVGYAIGLSPSLLGLLFLPAGWQAGWLFVTIVILAFGISALVLARVNPIIARSRFQPPNASNGIAAVSAMSCSRNWRQSAAWCWFDRRSIHRRSASAADRDLHSVQHKCPVLARKGPC
jgi:hypothetical protein